MKSSKEFINSRKSIFNFFLLSFSRFVFVFFANKLLKAVADCAQQHMTEQTVQGKLAMLKCLSHTFSLILLSERCPIILVLEY